MMLRSLVKKFKSHSLNEDASEEQQGEEQDTSAALTNTGQDQTEDVGHTTPTRQCFCPTIKSTAGNQEKTVRCQTETHQQCQLAGTNMGAVARHHLRNASGCNCCARGVSSIATRLRSSGLPSHSIVEHQQRHQRRPHNIFMHRRGSARSDRPNATSKAMGGLGMAGDDVCSRDSGTESDDEELEQIETNSTQSVPVSQTSDYYTSQQSLSINSCRSSHCSSPLLGLSDQECNSWESIGSESGINLQAPGGARHPKRHDQQHCQHHKYNVRSLHGIGVTSSSSSSTASGKISQFRNFDSTIIAAATMTPPSEMAEELPQHPYHTRQQFQRLTQQISMKNGITSLACSVDTSEQLEEDENNEGDDASGMEITNSSNTLGQQPTAFVPVRRQQPAGAVDGGSPEGAGGSSLDELEEVNFGGQPQQRASRRSRLSSVSIPTSCGISEKRKWSQMRVQEQKRPNISTSADEGEKKRQDRPILQAARKTPVKLLYPPLESGGEGKCTTTRSASRCQLHNQQLPQQGPLGAKKLRSTKKRCKAACDDESDGNGGNVEMQQQQNRRFSKEKQGVDEDEDDEEEDEEEEMGRFAKRPSLDFEKMRGKLVGDGAAGKNKKPKRSNTGTSFTGSRTKVFSNRRERYQLRSSRCRPCLFRPLDVPATTANEAPTEEQSSLSQGSVGSQPQQVQEPRQPWQQPLNGTFYFGGSNTAGQ